MDRTEDINNIKHLLDNKKKTFVVEARVDARTIASLIVYFNKKLGMKFNRSEMVRTGLEVYVDLLIKNGKLTPITSNYDALHIIQNAGYNIGKVGIKNNMLLSKEMQKESLILDGLDPSYTDEIETIKDSDIYKEATKILKEKRAMHVAKFDKDDIAGLPSKDDLKNAKKVTNIN